MSLKKCKECEHIVSDKAKICPSCGVGNPSDTLIWGRLATCGDCGHLVSFTAKTCPSCGAERNQKTETSSNLLKSIFEGVIGIIIWIIIIGIIVSKCDSDNKDAKVNNKPEPNVSQSK